MGELASSSNRASAPSGVTMSVMLFAVLNAFLLGLDRSLVDAERPRAINIGAVLTFDSVIGGVAKVAIEAAVDDINSNPSLLGGTRLNLIMEDTNCSAFLGSVGAFQVLEKDAFAIIGPQSSTVAHMLAFVANGLQVPLVSFAATDATLSSLQFPYFLRATQSDLYQMTAMAELINYYGWKEVISVFVDDDYGRNGVTLLSDALANVLSKIVYKVALPIGASPSIISQLLNRSKLSGSRIYVVHANPDSGNLIFSVARRLQMMTDGYVWFSTDWLSTTLDSFGATSSASLNLQGVIFFRQYIPRSSPRTSFESRWNKLRKEGRVNFQLNTYGFHAYDAVWIVAHAISVFLNETQNITFSSNNNLQDLNGKLQLGKLKTFDNGQLLLQKLLALKFSGIAGSVQFDSEQNLIRGAYEIMNVGNSVIRSVGYWSPNSGLTINIPSILYGSVPRNFSRNQHIRDVIWPGGKTLKPRGYVLATTEKPLKIGVPYRASYVEFVTRTRGSHEVEGYCIDVFKAALGLVPYDVPYQFVPFGDGHANPSYDALVHMVAENLFDAAVGDVTIVTNRTKVVDFTQPYTATGLVVLAPTGNTKSSTWVFLRPFTAKLWFTFSTLFNSQQEDTRSMLGRMVMMVWLFLLMVITSSYTASLTSFLTVQQLSSPIKGIESLVSSNTPIGYQVGSFARSYLIDNLNVHPSRLISLGSPEAYERALQLGPKNGGVAAIVDELPYVELFLMKTDGFGIVGKMFTKSGWGFAFPRDYPLAIDMSTAILRLSESGQLQKIHDKWLCKDSCYKHGADDSEPNQLHLSSFWGLFLLCGLVTIACLLIFLLRTIRQFIRYKRNHHDPSAIASNSSRSYSSIIYNFFDFVDEKEEATKKMFRQQESPAQHEIS